MDKVLRRTIKAAGGAKVLAEALPFRRDPEGAREAVLLLHGFTGHPGELSLMADALESKGFAVMAPRYPGHGSNGADFMASGARDWTRRAFDAWLELRSDYEKVHILGHSMGGAIATVLASAVDAPKLVLLAPALDLTGRHFALAPLVAPFLPLVRRDRPLPAEDRDETRKALFEAYRKDDHVREAAELYRLMKASRKALPRVRSRILLVTAEADEAVPGRVVSRIRKGAVSAASLEHRSLSGATHIFPFDKDGHASSALVADWMAKA